LSSFIVIFQQLFNTNFTNVIIMNIECSFKFLLKVGVEESIVNAPLVSLQSKNTNNTNSSTLTLRINLNEQPDIMITVRRLSNVGCGQPLDGCPPGKSRFLNTS
jgi:hypothetical protein